MAYSDLIEALNTKKSMLNGTIQHKEDLRFLQEGLPDGMAPGWFIDIMCQFALCGAHLELEEKHDLSGLGTSLGWLKPGDILTEAKDCQPGMSVLQLGFLPFGSDLTGSGDPYFLDLREHSDDPMVVRIPHDHAVEAVYPLEKTEPVCSLNKLIEASVV